MAGGHPDGGSPVSPTVFMIAPCGSHCYSSKWRGRSVLLTLKDEVGLVQAVKHRFGVRLEGRREEVVQVRLVGVVDSRNGDRAAVAGFAMEAPDTDERRSSVASCVCML